MILLDSTVSDYLTLQGGGALYAIQLFMVNWNLHD